MGEATQETPHVDQLPSALGPELADALEGRRPAVFLDYDGTLTPIVEHPDLALLSEATRRALQNLAGVCPIAVVSGRDRPDVAKKVGLGDIYYAGSHGFDISGPDGFHEERGDEIRSVLEEAAAELEERTSRLDGVWLERKRYAVAVHFRRAPSGVEEELEPLVRDVTSDRPQLRVSGGKKIFELRPALEWDKGKAVLWLRRVLGVAGDDYVTLYIGDDETDEDAFEVLRPEPNGLGIVVGISHRPTYARLSLVDTEEVRLLLERIADMETG
ncbi:MAG: trehalose-phosphatase [Actinomycetota bacterium]